MWEASGLAQCSHMLSPLLSGLQRGGASSAALRLVRLWTNLVSLRMPEEDGAVEVRDMHL